MSTLRPAFIIFLFLSIITGGIYPLVTTQLGQWWFPFQANGSLIIEHQQLRGSQLIGQNFSSAGYFQGRPSATAERPYNPLASGGSNLAASNPALDDAIAQREAQLRQHNPQEAGAIPVELLTASASGLDYSLTPQAVKWQIPRIAAARRLPAKTLTALVDKHTEQPVLRLLGQPVVNIVKLNLALDALTQHQDK